MGKKFGPMKATAERVARSIRRKTRKQHSAEDKIRTALCRREGIATSLDYSWSKEFLEARQKRLEDDTPRQASRAGVKDLSAEAAALKEAVADLTLENRLLKKSMLWKGATTHEAPCLIKA